MKKYHGCGNSFIITTYNKKYENLNFIKDICKDVDGFMMVKTNPLEMVLYNKDTSIAPMCGNGMRCFIQYCYDHNLLESDTNVVKTPSGNIYTKIINKDPFLVYVGLNEEYYTYIDNKEYTNVPYIINDTEYKISLVNSGVWHGIIIPDDFNKALEDAKILRELPEFKQWLNIDIIKITNEDIYVKTLERGVGYTKACGTGVAATYQILKKLGITEKDNIELTTDGGKIIAGKNETGPYIIGPSEFEKHIYLGNIDELLEHYKNNA